MLGLKPTQEGLDIAIATRGLQVELRFPPVVQLTDVDPPCAPQPYDFCGDVRAFPIDHTTVGHPPSVEGLFRNLYGHETDRDLRSA